jgi:hypothetical protein
MLIVAVSMTSREKSDVISVREFKIPKHPIIRSRIAGKRIIVSNSISMIILIIPMVVLFCPLDFIGLPSVTISFDLFPHFDFYFYAFASL